MLQRSPDGRAAPKAAPNFALMLVGGTTRIGMPAQCQQPKLVSSIEQILV
ncbi:hypothetical protein WKW77_05920 [Variovorax ureilyticus]|uniref:Uncharacterized protein n=1 Tax=Variovorax ureilyticus TaxID=1836198 RepID=A0ABU8VAB8_9BURK